MLQVVIMKETVKSSLKCLETRIIQCVDVMKQEERAGP